MNLFIFFSGKYFPEIIDLIYNFYFLSSLRQRHFGGFCNGVLRITYRCVGSTHPVPFWSMMGGDTSMYRWYMLWQATSSSRSLNGQITEMCRKERNIQRIIIWWGVSWILEYQYILSVTENKMVSGKSKFPLNQPCRNWYTIGKEERNSQSGNIFQKIIGWNL